MPVAKKQHVVKLSDREFQRLARLAEAMGVSTRTDAIRYALALVSKLVELESRGGKFLVEEPDGRVKEIIFPGLERNSEQNDAAHQG